MALPTWESGSKAAKKDPKTPNVPETTGVPGPPTVPREWMPEAAPERVVLNPPQADFEKIFAQLSTPAPRLEGPEFGVLSGSPLEAAEESGPATADTWRNAMAAPKRTKEAPTPVSDREVQLERVSQDDFLDAGPAKQLQIELNTMLQNLSQLDKQHRRSLKQEESGGLANDWAGSPVSQSISAGPLGVPSNISIPAEARKQLAPEYRETYEKLFPDATTSGVADGDEKGLRSLRRQIAPETVAFLQELELEGLGGDVRDFTSLRAGITNDEFDRYMESRNSAPTLLEPPGATTERDAIVAALMDNGRNLLKEYRKTGALDEDMGTALLTGRSETREALGIKDTDVERSLGFNPGSEVDLMFRQAFEAFLQNPEAIELDQPSWYVELDSRGIDGKAWDDYVSKRLDNAQRYRTPVGDDTSVKYKKPEEYRELFGLQRGS